MTESTQPIPWTDQLKRGEIDKLGEACDHFRQRLRRMIALRLDPRIRARLDESDVLQEVFVEAVRRIEEYVGDPRVEFYVWLRGLALQRVAKLARDHVTAQKRSTEREARWHEQSSIMLVDHLLSGGSGPLTNLLRRELREKVRQALEQLPDDYREAIAMRHFEEMSNLEVAQALGLTPSGATRRYGRALAELQRLIAAAIQDEESRP